MEVTDYERIEAEIKKIRYNLDVTEMEIGKRLLLLNLLRYDLSLIEDRDKVEKVKYNYKTKRLDFSESIEIGIAISLKINEVIREETELSRQQELYKCMQEVYYYLARYLFEYYLPAMEFGIPPEKQFIAPRTSVLNRIAKEMTKFYYRTDRPIMTLSMPQGTGKTEISKRFMSWAIGKNPELPNMMISYSANIAKDKFFNGIDALVKDDMGNYGKIFPKLREIYRSAETMSLDYTNEENRKKAHSEYTLYCVGFDGSITGRTRAHNILYADDLIKDIEEASNKDIMDKKWVEFTGTIKKRMQGRCKMLVVGTIFSINDPLSRLIQYYQENEPERLIVIRIPGLDENDESNFNYKYGFAITTKMFHEDRDLMDPVSFSCLIQQEPIEREGILFYENEFKKFDLSKYEQKEGYVRTVAFCDVAWGGEDYLSMPIVDEYEDGDCKLVDWYFINKADKTVTKPAIIQKIQQHKISRMCFEANNGGDEYADDIKRQLKEERVECYVESKKAPTTMSKTDRILNHQAEIRGSRASKYRLVIPERESIKGNKMFNEALNQVFKFNQSTSKNVRKRQHDDACFVGNTLISTLKGDKEIRKIKVGDKVITPFGLDVVEYCGITGEKEVITKFGLTCTKSHKVFSNKNKFEPMDTLTEVPEYSKMKLKELIIWKYKKLLYSMELNTNLWGRENIILANQIQIKEEKILKDFTLQFGNFIIKKKFLKATTFTIKMATLLIMTFLTWNVYQLGNIYQKKARKIGKILNTERKLLKTLKKGKKKQKNGIKVKKEENGIKNTQKHLFWQPKNTHINVCNVEKNILVPENLKQNFVVKSAEKNIDGKNAKKKEIVYNLKTKKYGCYYANGILVSNCDSLAGLFANVLGVKGNYGKAISNISREFLGI